MDQVHTCITGHGVGIEQTPYHICNYRSRDFHRECPNTVSSYTIFNGAW